jgi:hypothetical protein
MNNFGFPIDHCARKPVSHSRKLIRISRMTSGTSGMDAASGIFDGRCFDCETDSQKVHRGPRFQIGGQ